MHVCVMSVYVHPRAHVLAPTRPHARTHAHAHARTQEELRRRGEDEILRGVAGFYSELVSKEWGGVPASARRHRQTAALVFHLEMRWSSRVLSTAHDGAKYARWLIIWIYLCILISIYVYMSMIYMHIWGQVCQVADNMDISMHSYIHIRLYVHDLHAYMGPSMPGG